MPAQLRLRFESFGRSAQRASREAAELLAAAARRTATQSRTDSAERSADGGWGATNVEIAVGCSEPETVGFPPAEVYRSWGPHPAATLRSGELAKQS
jgi:hypothetical protein